MQLLEEYTNLLNLFLIFRKKKGENEDKKGEKSKRWRMNKEREETEGEGKRRKRYRRKMRIKGKIGEKKKGEEGYIGFYLRGKRRISKK